MAEARLNGLMKAWSKEDKDAFSGVFSGKQAPAPRENPATDAVAKMQAANVADPSVAERLAKTNAARAAFYGKQ